jgi:hypothetical protein
MFWNHSRLTRGFLTSLDERAEHEIVFPADAVDRLREARLQVGKDLVYLRSKLPRIEDLPSVAQVGDIHRSLLDLHAVSGVIDEKKIPGFRTNGISHLEAASKLRILLLEAVRVRCSLSEGWSQWLRQQYEAGVEAASVFSVLAQIADELDALLETRRRHFDLAFRWEDEWDSDEELFAAIRNLAAGRSAFGLKSVREKDGARAPSKSATEREKSCRTRRLGLHRIIRYAAPTNTRRRLPMELPVC